MSDDPITCPRCGGKCSIIDKQIEVQGKPLDVRKYKCVACGTGFYFEEDVVTFLVLKSVNK